MRALVRFTSQLSSSLILGARSEAELSYLMVCLPDVEVVLFWTICNQFVDYNIMKHTLST